MQHSSQELENQLHHTQINIQQDELPQEIMQTPAFTGEITIYANSKQVIWRAAVGVIGFLFILLLVPIIAVSDAAHGKPFDPGALIAFVVTLPITIFVGWITWTLFSPLFMHKPILTINHSGIIVRPIPLFSGFSILWGEIDTLAFLAYQNNLYLGIFPKNPQQFLKRFNSVERLIRQTNTIVGLPALVLPQINLEEPIEEILQQVCYIHTNELNHYQVQIRV